MPAVVVMVRLVPARATLLTTGGGVLVENIRNVPFTFNCQMSHRKPLPGMAGTRLLKAPLHWVAENN